jgi:hypothetical protein
MEQDEDLRPTFIIDFTSISEWILEKDPQIQNLIFPNSPTNQQFPPLATDCYNFYSNAVRKEAVAEAKSINTNNIKNNNVDSLLKAFLNGFKANHPYTLLFKILSFVQSNINTKIKLHLLQLECAKGKLYGPQSKAKDSGKLLLLLRNELSIFKFFFFFFRNYFCTLPQLL